MCMPNVCTSTYVQILIIFVSYVRARAPLDQRFSANSGSGRHASSYTQHYAIVDDDEMTFAATNSDVDALFGGVDHGFSRRLAAPSRDLELTSGAH